MSVSNKKRLARIKGINWKKVILWTFNIVCYVITFIFTISLIVGSIKKPSTQQQSSNSVIDLNQQQQYGLVVNSSTIRIESYEFNVPIYFDKLGGSPVISDALVNAYYNGQIVYSFVFDDFDNIDTGYLVLVDDITGNVYLNIDYVGFYFTDPDYVQIFPNISYLEITKNGSSQDFWAAVEYSFDIYYYGNPNEDIFDTIGDTIPSFVSTINSGLNEAITIFYDDGLTTIGYLSAIVVAVVLGYFSLRVVMGLIRLRG